MKSKKAMSPLFSTIILIGFAIALGGVVMSWGKSTYGNYEPGKIEVVCEKLSISLVDYGNNKGVCNKENALYVTMQNDGEVGIEGIKVSVLGKGSIYSTRVNKKIGAGDVVKLKVPYDNVGKIDKLIFVPITSLSGQEKVCPKNGFSVENVGEC
ncbi:MAG: hypothetical protein KKC75_08880 [Nanoarchaeota archaeon]|nr:hypothetical protein [Nanoarchaeota archaeon]MBU1005694.1 hypothetical protein [Nanoarchaeota archaeon]MBU1946415.1 hypothetical protein [Nanoarchaeota archaeon]